MSEGYHVPVMGQRVLDTLLVNRDGVYIDGTLGGGGHAKMFLASLSAKAVYIGIDRDQQAIDYVKDKFSESGNLFYFKGTFDRFDEAMNLAGVHEADALFLDLGVSSHQIDDARRGFGFRPGLNLDMRMDQSDEKTAGDILNLYSGDELFRIFKEFGEEKFSKNIARRIVNERQRDPLKTSDQLMDIIRRSVPGKFLVKSYARIFQALRIELNRELAILKLTLSKTTRLIKSGGRVGVISYHSGEDRIVKNFFKEQEDPCVCPKDIPYCVCGRKPAFKRLKPNLFLPDEEEILSNSRARSAKYRVGERL